MKLFWRQKLTPWYCNCSFTETFCTDLRKRLSYTNLNFLCGKVIFKWQSHVYCGHIIYYFQVQKILLSGCDRDFFLWCLPSLNCAIQINGTHLLAMTNRKRNRSVGKKPKVAPFCATLGCGHSEPWYGILLNHANTCEKEIIYTWNMFCAKVHVFSRIRWI